MRTLRVCAAVCIISQNHWSLRRYGDPWRYRMTENSAVFPDTPNPLTASVFLRYYLLSPPPPARVPRVRCGSLCSARTKLTSPWKRLHGEMSTRWTFTPREAGHGPTCTKSGCRDRTVQTPAGAEVILGVSCSTACSLHLVQRAVESTCVEIEVVSLPVGAQICRVVEVSSPVATC